MTVPLINARDVSKRFFTPDKTPVEVLRQVSLTVDPGEFVAIVGASGSGKSTLLYCLSGLETFDSGTVELQGMALSTLRPRDLALLRRDVAGFIFQAFNLIPSLTARQNVELPARLARRRVTAETVDRALAAVGLSDRADHKPGLLSGGQQQRVAIARALVSEPDVVFADEPTGALDSQSGQRVLDLLRGLAAGQRAVVMVTHDLEAAAQADRVLVLKDGEVHVELQNTTASAILTSLTAPVAVL